MENYSFYRHDYKENTDDERKLYFYRWLDFIIVIIQESFKMD